MSPTGGTIQRSGNFATGDHATLVSGAGVGGTDALRAVTAAIAQIRASLSEEPDRELREEVGDHLTTLDEALGARSSLDEHAWRERVQRAGRTTERLALRAVRFAAPLAQLVAAITALTGGHTPPSA